MSEYKIDMYMYASKGSRNPPPMAERTGESERKTLQGHMPAGMGCQSCLPWHLLYLVVTSAASCSVIHSLYVYVYV